MYGLNGTPLDCAMQPTLPGGIFRYDPWIKHFFKAYLKNAAPDLGDLFFLSFNYNVFVCMFTQHLLI